MSCPKLKGCVLLPMSPPEMDQELAVEYGGAVSRSKLKGLVCIVAPPLEQDSKPGGGI